MAIPAQKIENYPLYLKVLSPYIENKKVRYPLYALSVLAVAAAALRYGNTKVGFTLGSAGLFVQGYQVIQLAKEIKNTGLDDDTRNRKISRITDRVFTMSMMGGIIIGGLNLSLLYQEGSLLLQNADLSLWQNPSSISYAWLKNAPSIISHTHFVASIGCFAIPQALNFIRYGDDLFFGEKLYAKDVHEFCGKLVTVWTVSQEEPTLTTLPWLTMDMLQNIANWPHLSKFFEETSPHIAALGTAIKNLAVIYFGGPSFKVIHNGIASFSNPESNKLFARAEKKNESSWEKAKYLANYIFFYTLNFSLMAARIYHHPFPTAIFFAIGLAYPTSFQKEMTIRRTWEVAPDFIGMSLVLKCRYLFERLSIPSTALAWWNIPTACLNGLYQAENVRFYGRCFYQ
jgi:hypothetical protein